MFDWKRFAVGGATLGLSEPLYYQPQDRANEERDRAAADEAKRRAELEAERKRARDAQLGLVNSLNAPQVSDAQRRRIAALEEEAAAPIVGLDQDPTAQGARSQLVRGAAGALAGINNKQAAYGTSGGFSNQGSIQDTYDRLSGQLADMGQDSYNRQKTSKDAARDASASIQQAILDSQTEFENAKVRARQAIEAGDSNLAMQFIQQAYEAKDKYEQAYQQANNQLTQNLWGLAGAGVGAAATYATGGANKAGTAVYNNPYIAKIDSQMAQVPSAENFTMPSQTRTQLPYSLMRKR